MSTIVLRNTKGSELTYTELDNNFTNLNTDKLEKATDDTSTNSTFYPLFSSGTTSNAPKISTTKLSYNPSTGSLSSTIFVGALTGTASSATNATNTGITEDLATATSVYPTWVTSNTGNLPQKTSSTKLSFVPSTGVLTATSFSGAGTGLTGTASSLSIGGTATNATNTGITEDTATATAVYPTWVTANTGNLPQKTTSTKLSFVPSTGVLTATSFSGAGTGLTGTASSLTAGSATNATNATNTGITEDTATATAVYPTWVTANTGNLPQKTTSTKLSFVPSTGVLTATKFVGSITTTNITEKQIAIAASDIDLATGTYFTKTIGSATTFTVSNTPTSTNVASFILNLTNGGSATITWWTGVKWALGIAPTLTAAGRDVLGFFTYDGGTTWTGLLLGKDVK